MKRNLINEITAIKSRSEYNSRHVYGLQLAQIEFAFKEYLNFNDSFDKELLKYIPIATVACFEAFFRSVYKDLVDFGKPFSDNATKFNQSQNVKFDFDIINAIQSKVVTIGEFISHILPCNNFDDINSNLSTIIGIDFVKEIKSFQRESIIEEIRDNSRMFIENSDQIISDIKRTFELRHIYCHEFTSDIKVDKDEILKCFSSSKIFLNQTYDFIWNLLYPGAPESREESKRQSYDNFEKLDSELTELILTIKSASHTVSLLDFKHELLDESIKTWKEYREIKAKLDASGSEGGLIYPIIYNLSLITTTKEKIESLQNEYATGLKKYASR